MLERKISQNIFTPHEIFLIGLPTDKLLSRLFREDKLSEAAWGEFLRRYSNLILKIIWRYKRNYDEVMEQYVVICSKLLENHFRILKKYQTDFNGLRPKFSTWLTTVVNNLCIDIYRRSHGRRRFPRGIKNLPKEDRLFFELYYWKRLSLEEISDIMNLSSKPDSESVHDKLTHIESLLTRTPRPQNVLWQKDTISFDEETYMPETVDTAVYEDGIDESDLSTKIESLIANLSVQEKVVVRLRFWENLSAREISEIIHIKPYYKVYSILDKALESIRNNVYVTNPSPKKGVFKNL